MNFDDYCHQKASPPGSAHYYAIHVAPARCRLSLTALYAFKQELIQTIHQNKDLHIAQTKFAWWRQEIHLLGTRLSSHPAPSHPILLSLKTHFPNIIHYREILANIVVAYEEDLLQTRYLDWPDFLQYAQATEGKFSVLVAAMTEELLRPIKKSLFRLAPTLNTLTDEANIPLVDNKKLFLQYEWAKQLGIALAIANKVINLGENARKGRIYLPISEMQRFNVPAADMINSQYSVQYSALMHFECERAQQYLQKALQEIPQINRSQHKTLRALGAMSLALVKEIERNRYQILHQRIMLTPLRLFFISRTCAKWL